MTYCLALNVAEGVVMLADTRTNAGVDNISTYPKLFTWERAGDPSGVGPIGRALGVMTAGNLSVTQEILSLVEEEIASNGPNQDGGLETILSAPNMFRVATRLGELMTDVQARRGPQLAGAGVASGASMILAGQIGAAPTRMFLIYSAGNFIEAQRDTPFLQIGEFKYGKPILDRMLTQQTPMNDAVTAALLSMDATLRSNLTVGLPVDLAVLTPGALSWRRRRVEADDPTYREISNRWGEHLREGFKSTPNLPW